MPIESTVNDEQTEQIITVKRKFPYAYPIKKSEEHNILPYDIELIAINMREEYEQGNTVEFVEKLRYLKREVAKLSKKYRGDLDA